ncbi:hypothetical protein [Actinomyces slackii]|uniref:hypothetical protein n=1 Tax=Actinomyces slackii TaxID=52774 RepID=UPI000F838D5A|nr:hypothetical protein [Actinomyces slackii]
MRLTAATRPIVVSTIIAFFLWMISYGLPAQAREEGYSDQQVVKGLMYGVGPVAEEIGFEIQLPESISEQEYVNAVDHTVNDLIATRSNEIHSAVTLIKSDDPLEVEKGLDALAQVGISYAEEKMPEVVDQEPQPAACGAAVVCVAYLAAAVHNTVAITAFGAVVIGAAVYAGAWLWGPASAKVSAATRESFVVDVIEGVN